MPRAESDYRWIKIFEGVNHSSHIAAALAASRRVRLVDGEMLIEAGQQNHHLYILLTGRMEARLTQDATQTGMPISPGEAIGEMSIIDGYTASAYVYSVGGEIDAYRDNAHGLPLSRLLNGRLRNHHFGTPLPCGFHAASSGRGSPFHSLGVPRWYSPHHAWRPTQGNVQRCAWLGVSVPANCGGKRWQVPPVIS